MQEFIFRVLKHLVIGGGMSQVAHSFVIVREGFHLFLQYDDEWKPYADTVLAMCSTPFSSLNNVQRLTVPQV
jgi:DNA-binding phage protein